ncbi:proteoglycan 4b isoform X13 [Sinocyclocheilus grahami]|uniref:proteoglycan 4b isoform X13 n=1 Tax=Sinocyclocheilus grahami TaxID=75366 RepID=UPI0007AD4A64|nr:PREDICTED: proteoglycan 4-like isoform X13 [Sinocyclocheilus grahami]
MATHLSLLLLFAYASTGSSDPSSCRGRCGEGYYRGSLCQCDYECLSLNECCSDFTQMCTTKDSCKGRCGEPFHRGNPCHCDIDCVSYNQCCPDYEDMCLVEDTALKPRKTATAAQRTANLCLNIKNKKSTETSNEEMTNDEGIGEELTIPEDESESTPSEGLVLSSTDASSMLPADENPTEGPSSTAPTEGPSSTAPTEGPSGTAPTEVSSSALPTDNYVTEMTTKAQSENPEELSSLKDPRATPVPKKTPSAPAPVKPTKKTIKPSIDKNDKSEPKEPLKDPSGIVPIKPAEKPLKPSSDKNGKTDSIKDYQADDYDTNLCSGRPVSGLTTLRNGTIVVFRGHYFWTLDKQRNPDPPQLITNVWGIPSPIDTVYTRCNCQGKTYFFKGRNYWRFENGMMDPGFPKPISQGFGQIGYITAALSIPQYRSRKETVIFFRRGGMAQTYTYQVTPSCGKKPRYPVFTVRTRARRQAVLPGTDISPRPQIGHFVPDAALGQVISISKTWRGFPTIVTSAVSVPSRVKEGYKYYVFSQNKYYSMKMEREKPVILKPATGPKESSATSFFKCPETSKN